MESQASSAKSDPTLRKRRRWRLRILLAFGVLVLMLTGAKIEGPGLSRIAAFRDLEHLLLNGGAVTDDGLRHLAGAHSLVRLHLDGMPFSAAGLKPVIALPRLRYLSIRGCQVPYDDVEQMRTDMPALRIDR